MRYKNSYRFKKTKRNYILILGILLLGISIGYAILSTPLNINGTSEISSTTWDVHWNNIVENEENTATKNTQAKIEPNTTTATFDITLSTPGDFYEFTIDAVNAGTIDAMIDSITNKVYAANGTTEISLPNYLNYTVTYRDGITVAPKHLLEASTTERYKVRVEFKRDIDTSQLPTTATTIKFAFTINYVQADNTAVVRDKNNQIYAFNTLANINTSISNLGTTSMNYQDIINFSGHNFYLKHMIDDQDRIESSSVGYVLNSTPYTLIGGDSGASFDTNKTTLINSFGSSNCTIEDHYVYCTLPGIDADTNYDGTVSASDATHMCTVHANKSSECMEM